MKNIKFLYIISFISILTLFLTVVLVNYLSINLDTIDTTTPTPITKINKKIKTIEVLPTSSSYPNNNLPTSPSISNTIIPTSNPLSTRCIIMVDNTKYDVTVFKNSHSGGDIFKCGQDMTADFWGQHGQKQLNLIQKYRI